MHPSMNSVHSLTSDADEPLTAFYCPKWCSLKCLLLLSCAAVWPPSVVFKALCKQSWTGLEVHTHRLLIVNRFTLPKCSKYFDAILRTAQRLNLERKILFALGGGPAPSYCVERRGEGLGRLFDLGKMAAMEATYGDWSSRI